jgi:hypothetical protein
MSSLNRSKEGLVEASIYNNQNIPNRLNYRLGDKFAAGLKHKKKNNVHTIYDNNFSATTINNQNKMMSIRNPGDASQSP